VRVHSLAKTTRDPSLKESRTVAVAFINGRHWPRSSSFAPPLISNGPVDIGERRSFIFVFETYYIYRLFFRGPLGRLVPRQLPQLPIARWRRLAPSNARCSAPCRRRIAVVMFLRDRVCDQHTPLRAARWVRPRRRHSLRAAGNETRGHAMFQCRKRPAS
jgi:hypothetical protein